MARVTVLTLNYSPEPTGIAPYASQLASGLQARGHEVQVLTAYPHYPEWRVMPGYTGLVHREVVGEIPVTRLRHYVPSSPTGLVRALSEVSFGLRLLAASWHDPDVVICMSPALISSAMAVTRGRARRRRPAIGVIVQDLYSVGAGETHLAGGASVARVLGAVEGRTLRAADGVSVIHDRFKTRVVADLGVEEDRVAVIRNWTHVATADDFDREAFRASLGWAADETIVLHSGAMGEKQGLSNVVEAARQAEAQDHRARFVLMGDGGQRGRLQAEGEGVASLDFLPPTSDEVYPRMLAAADVLLVNELPGLMEMAVPSKLTSYFASGRPVLAATDAGSTTAEELYASGAGVCVTAGDPSAVLAGVDDLVRDPSSAALMGKRGREYGHRVLSADASLDAYDRWVYELAARREDGSDKEGSGDRHHRPRRVLPGRAVARQGL